MQYIIMFLIVIGLSTIDFLTGMIKAHVKNDYSSTVMRLGLYHKAMEWLVMLASIGLEIGLELLGAYYQVSELSDIAGLIAAVSVFIYILIMETISILENFSEVNPEATFARKLIKKLRKFSNDEEE